MTTVRTDKPLDLITGAAGIVGTHLADDLYHQGRRVRVLDLKRWPLYPPETEVIPGDVRDAETIGKIQAAITKTEPSVDFTQIIDVQLRKGVGASFVAEVDGKVVGYMISYIIHGGFGLETSAWIAMLGVDPKGMGQGIGKRLAQEIMNVYRGMGVKHVFTSVPWDSVDLLSFFKTLGFDRSSFINLRKELDP